LEGSGRGVYLEGLRKTTENLVMIAGLRAEILTRDLSNLIVEDEIRSSRHGDICTE
jgi:hypothetical protein